MIGCECGYYGVGFGGIFVGGIVVNWKIFGILLIGVDYMCYIYDLDCNVFFCGMLENGVEYVEDLICII